MSYHALLSAQLARLPDITRPTILRVVIPLPAIDALAWLAAQPCWPKYYWQSRDHQRGAACCGCSFAKPLYSSTAATTEQWIPLALDDTQLPWRYYGGHGFTPDDPTVSAQAGNQFVLPQWELRRDGEHHQLLAYLVCHPAPGKEACQQWQRQFDDRLNTKHEHCAMPLVVQQRHSPEFSAWQDLIERVTTPEQLHQQPKVVLSRQTELTLSHPYTPWQLMANWRRHQPDCYQFIIEAAPGDAFLGCSPERLFKRTDRQLESEALAGTCRRHNDPKQDQRQGKLLLADTKNQQENRWVVDDIVQQLHPLSTNIDVAQQAQLRQLANVMHLHRPIRATLHAGVTDQALLAALHPTAAVGGVPRQRAQAFIHDWEPIDRGWYAGAFGYSAETQSEFCVTIRSARLQQQTLTLYAGAGIVAGSRAEEEWRELDQKISGINQLFKP